MTSWGVFVAVGFGSYVFRVLPLVARRDGELPERADRCIQHAGTAAITALLVSSMLGAAGAVPLPVIVGSVIAGLTAAVRGASMLRVVLVGVAVVTAVRLAVVALSSIGMMS